MADPRADPGFSPETRCTLTTPVQVYWPYFLGSHNPISYLFREISSYFEGKEFNITTFCVSDTAVTNTPDIAKIPSSDFNTWRGRLSALQYSLKQYDLLHTGGIPLLHSVVATAAHLRNPDLSHVHTYRVDVDPTSDRLPTNTRRKLGEMAEVVTAVSRHTAQTVEDVFGFEPRVIYNGVNTDIFHPDHEEPALFRRLEIEPPVILYVGTFEKRKHPFHLVEVARRLPEVTFLVVGGGGMDNWNERVEVEMASVDNLHYVGSIDKGRIPPMYSNADGFLFPSTQEGCSNAVLEAMASETPVVGYDASSIPELVTDGKTGYLSQPGDIDGLVKGVERVLWETSSQLGRNARAYVKEHHNFETLASQYQDAYRAAVGD